MVLVPLGLLLMALYHAHLLFKVKYHPEDTVIGVNHFNRQAWVINIMSDGVKNGVLAVQTLRNSIMASTLLASTAITLSSLIGALVSNTSGGSSKSLRTFVYGETRSITSNLKYLCLLLCFLFAFLCFVQSIRYASHVSFLVSIPVGDNAPGLTPEYVNQFIYRSQNFFSLGMRGYYFSFSLLLWIFGPIPMFVCSVVMIFLLYSLDKAKDFNLTFKILNSGRLGNVVNMDREFLVQELVDATRGMGTKDDDLIRVITTRAEFDMYYIKQEFLALTNKPLEQVIASETSGDYQHFLLSVVGGV